MNIPFLGFAEGTEFVATKAAETVSFATPTPMFAIVGIGLIIATIFILFFLKKVIMNSIVGGVFWAIAVFIFHVELPLFPSFVVSVVVGPAGIGTMLLLKYFGLLVV